MEVQNVRSSTITNNKEGDDDFPLPGFRFHPTDEELVGFYLRRKVEKRPISIELIKQADIYKYDPWDLPKSNTIGDNNTEWYFYCKRGRKYRNSIRPNRVTGSGFWKATGIDKPIYSSSSNCIIGLKKSLVYYCGSAGKGTKTDWMMHEFRLPPPTATTKNMDSKPVAQEAEVWTICRILKRNVSYRKYIPDNCREVSTNSTIISPLVLNNAISKTCNINSSDDQTSYISFNNAPAIIKQNDEKKPYFPHIANQHFLSHFSSSSSSSVISQAPSDASSSFSSSMCGDMNEFLGHADWEDLRSIVDFSVAATTTNPFYL
ncbi:hypothetical protein BUALT_Bualt18G0083900 [Buddleja alternifolia]|uniref:NAC domain-containing protein n=1 Tax=Buddleja alternifolia TaxID=168488 RepID=A0AAV6W9W2_9LAMI|nr:hypothetical protein BUALT_Bualt18G0083900 [Buddleja alternifolia]